MGTLKARVSGNWVNILGSGQDAANVAKWNSAWGIQAQTIVTTDISGIQTTDVTVASISNFTMTAGRQYKITGDLMLSKAAPDTATTATVKLVMDATTLIYRTISMTAPGNQACHLGLEYTGGGAHNLLLTVNTAAGYVNVPSGGRTWIAIEDIGPITPASIAPPTAGPRVVASGNALGVVAVGSMLGGTPTVIAANTWGKISNNLSVFLAVGRRYRVVGIPRAVIAVGSGTSQSESRLDLDATEYGRRWNFIGAGFGHVVDEWLLDGDDATHTLSLSWNGSTPGLNVYTDQSSPGSAQFWVEDVGPNTYPALPLPATPPAWTPVSAFLNGWVNYGGQYPVAAYRKIGDEVQLRGLIKGGTINQNAFQLPAGFRPAWQQFLAAASNDAYGEIVVVPDGTVRPGVGSNAWIDLSTVRFSTTA